MKWYDPSRKMPKRFEPLLLYLPGDAPMQTVYEGYWSKGTDPLLTSSHGICK